MGLNPAFTALQWFVETCLSEAMMWFVYQLASVGKTKEVAIWRPHPAGATQIKSRILRSNGSVDAEDRSRDRVVVGIYSPRIQEMLFDNESFRAKQSPRLRRPVVRKRVCWYLDNAKRIERFVSGSYRDWLQKNYSNR